MWICETQKMGTNVALINYNGPRINSQCVLYAYVQIP